jgi:hypothetical protein
MTITLPLWFVVAQWVLLFALGMLIIILYRQLGFLLHLRDQGTAQEGLPIGERAPSFEYALINENAQAVHHFEPRAVWTLLVFAEPGCVSCKKTIGALEQLTPKFKQQLQPLIVTSAEPELIAAVDEFANTPLALGRIDRTVSQRLYRTRSTPFAYLINPDGVVEAKGVVSDETAIRRLITRVGRTTNTREELPVLKQS